MDGIEASPESFCRICAMKSNQVQNLFEIIQNGVTLAEMLQHCLKRGVNRTDGLPANICASCKTNLISTYEFHNLCERSERYFLSKFPSNVPSNEFKPNSQSVASGNDRKVFDYDVEIKTEDDYDLSHINVENMDFIAKGEEQPALISELICVEENFDVNSMIVEENAESEPHTVRINCQTPSKSTSLRKSQLKWDRRSYECYECKRNFDHFNELRHHLNDHDNTRKPFECTTCNMRFVHLNSWFRHRSRHTKNIHDCEYCSEAFNTLTALKQHIQETHKEQLKAYKCNQCHEEFALHFLLVWHNEWHKKAKQFVCTTCDAVFFSERKLKAHIRDNHASKQLLTSYNHFKNMF